MDLLDTLRVWKLWKKLKKKIKCVKIICLVRDPIERAYSHFLFAKQKGFEPSTITFEQVIDNPQRKINNYIRSVDYLYGSKYKTHLSNLFNFFDRSDVYIDTLERFKIEPKAVLSEINYHLGVNNFEYHIDIGEKAKSGISKNIYLEKLTNGLFKLRFMAPSFLRKGIFRNIHQNIHNKNLYKPKMNEPLINRLKLKFEEDKDYVNSLGVNINYWKNF